MCKKILLFCGLVLLVFPWFGLLLFKTTFLNPYEEVLNATFKEIQAPQVLEREGVNTVYDIGAQSFSIPSEYSLNSNQDKLVQVLESSNGDKLHISKVNLGEDCVSFKDIYLLSLRDLNVWNPLIFQEYNKAKKLLLKKVSFPMSEERFFYKEFSWVFISKLNDKFWRVEHQKKCSLFSMDMFFKEKPALSVDEIAQKFRPIF